MSFGKKSDIIRNKLHQVLNQPAKVRKLCLAKLDKGDLDVIVKQISGDKHSNPDENICARPPQNNSISN